MNYLGELQYSVIIIVFEMFLKTSTEAKWVKKASEKVEVKDLSP